MKVVVEVRSDYPDEQVLEILKRIAGQGSFSHPAYAELQGRDTRLVVEIIGTARQVAAPSPYSRYAIRPLDSPRGAS